MKYEGVHRSEGGTVFGYTPEHGSRTFLAGPVDRSALFLSYPRQAVKILEVMPSVERVRIFRGVGIGRLVLEVTRGR